MPPMSFAIAGPSKWQDDASEVSDPSDWLKGPFAFMRDLDASLRCEICSDILRAPVSIKTCSHVFCSQCIRDYINQPSAPGAPTDRPCPNCRQPKVYDSELVPVVPLEIAAEAWRKARPMLRAKDAEERESKERDEARERADALAESANGRSTRLGSEEAGSSSSKKRRLETSDGNGSFNGDSSRRLTRSSAAQTSSGPDQQPRQPSRLGEDVHGAISVDDDDDNDDDADWNLDTERRSPVKASNGAAAKANGSRSSSSKGKNKELKDISATDVFPCPMCTFSGTLQALNRHLDTPGACPTSDDPSKKNGNGAGVKGMSGWFSKGASAGPSAPLVKLKRPQYQLLSEKALRKLCEESGLTTTGHRSLLEARHRRWIDLFNSDLDASPAYRRGVGKLKKEMREWEKGREREEAEKARSKGVSTSTSSSSSTTSSSMGGHHASSAAPNVGASEEERRAYAHAQRDHFKEIVEQARMSHQKNKVVHREELPAEDNGGGGGSGGDGHGSAEEKTEGEGAQEKAEGEGAQDGQSESNVKTDVASAGAAEEGEEAMVGQQHEAAGGVQAEYQTLPAATNAPAPAP